MKVLLARFVREESGATGIDYALVAAGMSGRHHHHGVGPRLETEHGFHDAASSARMSTGLLWTGTASRHRKSAPNPYLNCTGERRRRLD